MPQADVIYDVANTIIEETSRQNAGLIKAIESMHSNEWIPIIISGIAVFISVITIIISRSDERRKYRNQFRVCYYRSNLSILLEKILPNNLGLVNIETYEIDLNKFSNIMNGLLGNRLNIGVFKYLDNRFYKRLNVKREEIEDSLSQLAMEAYRLTDKLSAHNINITRTNICNDYQTFATEIANSKLQKNVINYEDYYAKLIKALEDDPCMKLVKSKGIINDYDNLKAIDKCMVKLKKRKKPKKSARYMMKKYQKILNLYDKYIKEGRFKRFKKLDARFEESIKDIYSLVERFLK